MLDERGEPIVTQETTMDVNTGMVLSSGYYAYLADSGFPINLKSWRNAVPSFEVFWDSVSRTMDGKREWRIPDHRPPRRRVPNNDDPAPNPVTGMVQTTGTRALDVGG